MAEIDLIFAKARYSLDYRMTAVDLSTDGRLVLRKARHPLLEAILRRDPALPLDDTAAAGDVRVSKRGRARRPRRSRRRGPNRRIARSCRSTSISVFGSECW